MSSSRAAWAPSASLRPLGDARIEDTERLELKVSAGSAVLGRVAGPAHIRVSAGSAAAREIRERGHDPRQANGTRTIGAVTGSLQSPERTAR